MKPKRTRKQINKLIESVRKAHRVDKWMKPFPLPRKKIAIDFKHGLSVAYIANKYWMAESVVEQVIREWMNKHTEITSRKV